LPVGCKALTRVGALVKAGVTDAEAVEATESPFMLVAITVKVYAVPFVRPVMVTGEEVTETLFPSLPITVYPVIDEPPLFVGAVNETTALAFPDATMTFVGAFGTVEGVTELDAVDGEDVPIPFVAVTLNVYAVPFVKPVTVQL
jgi:hypothetical protein